MEQFIPCHCCRTRNGGLKCRNCDLMLATAKREGKRKEGEWASFVCHEIEVTNAFSRLRAVHSTATLWIPVPVAFQPTSASLSSSSNLITRPYFIRRSNSVDSIRL